MSKAATLPAAPEQEERWPVSSPELDEAERQWWERYAWVEEEYCWVQPPEIHRFLRGRYVRDIVRQLPDGARILEVGCGAGWLTRMLAESGQAVVHGCDFSAEQIRRAERFISDSRARERIRLHLLETSLAELANDAVFLVDGPFDVMVVHGVLHHLAVSEIEELLVTFFERLGASDARAFLFEPVRQAGGQRRFIHWLCDLVACLPLAGQRLGVRKRCPEETRVWNAVCERSVVASPRGPSPKEMPFLPGELERLIQPHAKVIRSTPALLSSFHAARNWLLLRLTYPRVANIVKWPYLWLVRAFERQLLKSRKFAPGTVAHELLECRKHGA